MILKALYSHSCEYCRQQLSTPCCIPWSSGDEVRLGETSRDFHFFYQLAPVPGTSVQQEKNTELTRLMLTFTGPSTSTKPHLQEPGHSHVQPSPLSCVLLRHSSILSAFSDFWENSATMATAVSDRLTHTRNVGADASEFLPLSNPSTSLTH